jgi:type 1 fimbria pilin
LRGRPKKKVRSAVVIEMIMGVINLQGEGVTRTQKEVGMDIGLQEMTLGTVIMSEIEEIEDVGEMTGRVTETCTATRTKIGTETGIENVAGSKTVTGVVVVRIETGIGSIRIGSGQGNENVYESVTDSWISSNHLTILCFSVFPLGWGNRMLFPSSVWFRSSVEYGNLTFSEVKAKSFACRS